MPVLSKGVQMQEGSHFRSYIGHMNKHVCADRVSIMHAQGTGLPHPPLLHLCTLGVLRDIHHVDGLCCSNDLLSLWLHPCCDE